MRTLSFVLILFLTRLSAPIPLEDFYPYGASHGDSEVPTLDDGSSPVVTISTLFPFFNNQHDSLYVNTNGVISFLRTLTSFTPDPFPLNNSRRIIAPFWADVDTTNGGIIWYRETTTMSVLQRATEEVKLYYPSQTSFLASWVFIATWNDVAVYGVDSELNIRNTFQAVLVTNGRHSFTIFNYYEINWTTGTASGGTDEGLGGTPAQVGFNAGDGINYYAVNGSRTDAIINLPQMSNVEVDGKFVFRIDTETIEQGGCNTGGSLTISPRYSHMFGGERKIVAGPCIQSDDVVTASFGSGDTVRCVMESRYSVICLTPTFYVTGDVSVTLNVTTSDQKCDQQSCLYNAVFQGKITILNPLNTKPVLQTLNPSDWIRRQLVTMEWQTEDIPFIYSMEGSTVELHTVKFDSDNKPRLQYNSTVVLFIDTLQTEVSFNLETDDDVIVLSLVEPANDTDQNMRQRVWSDAIVVIPRDETESRMSCQRWKAEDNMLPFLSEIQVQVCPCRFDQANIDVIRFHPDPLCQSQESSTRPNTNCLYHPRARQCFRLNTPGTIGTGQLCCYDNNGNLMDMLTSSGGGFLERFHYFGDGEAVVPYLSNIVFDTAPYYHCCVYPQSTLKSGVASECYEFYQRRKTGNCKEFVPNIPAQNFGDPHFVTPDGLTYTFNGVGEFVLFRTKSKTFETQVRMQPFIANNDKRGSLITSIVLKAINVSDTVEIKLNSIRAFDILINGVVQDITGITFIRYTGVTISVHDVNMTGDGHTKEVNIAFPDIGFQTLVFGSFLNYFVSFGPSIEQGSIEGLLGNFNNDPNDDLVSRAGDVLPSDSSTEHIHNNMGITWRVTAEESLFTYAVGTSHSSIQDTAYVPTFEVPQSAIDDTMRAICGNDTFCAYDYYVRNDMTVAIATQISGDTFQRIQEISRPVVTCGIPPAVEYGQWNTSGMEVGDTGELVCNTGRQLQGSGYITCNMSGDWTNSQSSCVIPVVTCGIPPSVDYGQWNTSGMEVGDSGQLLCNSGTQLQGSGYITCNASGDWTDSQSSCIVSDSFWTFMVIIGIMSAFVLLALVVAFLIIYSCSQDVKSKPSEGRYYRTTRRFDKPSEGRYYRTSRRFDNAAYTSTRY